MLAVKTLYNETKESQVKNHIKNLNIAFDQVASSYLEHKGLTGGGTKTCGRSFAILNKEQENAKHALRLYCYSTGCKECAKKNGRLHKRRKNKLYDFLKDKAFYQIVFTVPRHLRENLKSRDMIKKYKRLTMRIIKDFFAGNEFVFYLHLKGDKDEKEFNIHANFHVVTDNKLMKLEKEFIELIKQRYLRALRALLKEKIEKVDVNVSFIKKNEKVQIKKHRIKYMSNPEKNRFYDEFTGGDVYMKRFKCVEIKRKKRENTEDVDVDELKELKKQGYKVLGFVNATVFENLFECPDVDGVFKLKTRNGLDENQAIELLQKTGMLKRGF